MLLDPQILSQTNSPSPQIADSQLARALMSQAIPPPSVNAQTNPFGGLSLQSLLNMKNQHGQQTQQGPQPQSTVGNFFNGNQSFDPYSGAQYSTGGLWNNIAGMFQAAAK